MVTIKTVSGHGKSTVNLSAQPKGSVKDMLGPSKSIQDRLGPCSQSVGNKETYGGDVKCRLFSTARKETRPNERVEDNPSRTRSQGDRNSRQDDRDERRTILAKKVQEANNAVKALLLRGVQINRFFRFLDEPARSL